MFLLCCCCQRASERGQRLETRVYSRQGGQICRSNSEKIRLLTWQLLLPLSILHPKEEMQTRWECCDTIISIHEDTQETSSWSQLSTHAASWILRTASMLIDGVHMDFFIWKSTLLMSWRSLVNKMKWPYTISKQIGPSQPNHWL